MRPPDSMNSPQTDKVLATLTGELESAGFHMLGEMRDFMRERAGDDRPALARVLADDEGTVTAAVYRSPLAGAAERGAGIFHAIDLETPLDDGTFLTTSTAPGAGLVEQSPQVRSECLAAGTDVSTLLERHRLRVAEWLRTRPSVSPLRSHTIEDVIGHRQRLDAIHAACRRDRTPGTGGRHPA